jgi:hypothetical protein
MSAQLACDHSGQGRVGLAAGTVRVASVLHLITDAERMRTPDGEPVMPKIREALAFWGRCLSDAERAFTEPAI